MKLEDVFRRARVAASNAGTGFERLRNDARNTFPLLVVNPNKRMRYTKRKDQAEQFALEEAELHQQLLIEQDIFERRVQQQQQEGRDEQPTVDVHQEEPAEQRDEPPETTVQPSSVPAEPIRLAPAPKNSDKIFAIERKLSLIRQRLAAPPKKNEAGIAVLRAAVAC